MLRFLIAGLMMLDGVAVMAQQPEAPPSTPPDSEAEAPQAAAAESEAPGDGAEGPGGDAAPTETAEDPAPSGDARPKDEAPKEVSPEKAETSDTVEPSEAATEAAAGRTLRGRVLERPGAIPVAGAKIRIADTVLSAVSAADGTFEIAGAPPGALRLIVEARGFPEEEVRVAIGATEVTVPLRSESVEEIVVTGRATTMARRNLANAVTTVSAKQLSDVSSQTLTEALHGKVPGANIQSNSGAPGGGIQLRLRGVSTIKGRTEPLYVIDGVILSDATVQPGLFEVSGSAEGSSTAATQDNPVNRIADLNPNDIASIEILKGASAAAIYGSKASNGVVIITTKRGSYGEPRINLTQRLGFYELSNTVGSRAFTREEVAEAYGEDALEYYDGKTYDHERDLAGRRDLSTETVVNVTGGSATYGSDYYVSLLVKDDAGIIRNTGYEKQSGLIKLGQQIGGGLELVATANLIHSDTARSLTNNDNRNTSHYMVLAGTPSFVRLKKNPDGTYPKNALVGSEANPLQTAALMQESQEVWRMIGSLTGTLTILESETQTFRLLANLGADNYQQRDDYLFPPELYFEDKDGLPGTSLNTDTKGLNLNAGFNLLHIYEPPSEVFRATTSAGVQLESRSLDWLRLVSRNLNAGQSNVDAGSVVVVTEQREKIRDRGYYIQEEVLTLDETLSLTAALRAEQSSLNGDPNRLFYYPKGAAAYTLEMLPDLFDYTKVRVAYGETGNQPLYGQKFTPLNATTNIEGQPGLDSRLRLGAKDIEPERQREIEGGVDVSLLDGRGRLEFTAYQRTISNLLLQRTPAPSSGYDVEFLNGGTLRNRGIETALQVAPFRSEITNWLARLTFSVNRSRVMDLDVETFDTGGFGTGLGVYRIEVGKSATQIVGDSPDGDVVKLGDAEPDFRVAFFNSVSYMGLGLSFLLDWQQGSDVVNLTRLLRDANGTSPDVEKAAERFGKWLNDDAGVYIEDATYVKLREIALWWTVPPEWLSPLQIIDRARLTLTGRNLLTFTNYSGMDPEVSNFGNQAIARNIDVAPYPPSRSYWMSVDLGF